MWIHYLFIYFLYIDKLNDLVDLFAFIRRRMLTPPPPPYRRNQGFKPQASPRGKAGHKKKTCQIVLGKPGAYRPAFSGFTTDTYPTPPKHCGPTTTTALPCPVLSLSILFLAPV